MLVQALLRLERWFETMRGPDGYGGPVAHWWQNCLQFTGAGLDWRYEGLISGYLILFEKTGQEQWLLKARRAGDDLVRGQLPGGNFQNSSFEQNPYPAGTPHEAAADLALLRLAAALRDQGDAGWKTYLETAERNIQAYYFARLWDAEALSFRDHPDIPSFVPNKAATLVEALFALSKLEDDDEIVKRYALPTLEAILNHQVEDGRLDGAIYQNSMHDRPTEKFFPYYIARCVPGMIAGYEWSKDDRFLEAAIRAMSFVMRSRYEDGSFPQVVYGNGRVNRYPQWVAAVGDVLRALQILEPLGFQADSRPTLGWLLNGQMSTGGIRTASGFSSQISQRQPDPMSEFRDILPVAGWNDKAFRYLSGIIDPVRMSSLSKSRHEETLAPFQEDCLFDKRKGRYYEDSYQLSLTVGERRIYHYRKGADWAESDVLALLK